MPISLSLSAYTPISFALSIKMDRVKPIVAMKVEIRSRKLIKPSVTTPHTLRHYKIGFIDEFAPMVNVPLVLFFPPNSNYNPHFIAHLEGSLRKTLTMFYPLAGRYMEDILTVDCNDQGVEFIQAQVDITVQEMLDTKLDPNLINEFIPTKNSDEIENQAHEPILATQVTFFECGGCALSLSIAHKIGDAFTMSTFFNQWATLSRRDIYKVEHLGLGFMSSSLFPARGLPSLKVGYTTLTYNDEYVTKKLSFNESAISNMKAKAKSNEKINTRQISKVQLVSALIWKVFINADHAINDYPSDSILVQPINLRKKSVSPQDSFGNLWGLIDTTYSSTSRMLKGYEELAYLLTDCVKKTFKDYSKVDQDSQKRKEMVLSSFSRINNIPHTTNLIFLTSWCKLPFYHINFGYGKPIWISCGCVPMKRGMLLLDDVEDNGVEAYVSMRLKDVPFFEKDDDIKAFSP